MKGTLYIAPRTPDREPASAPGSGTCVILGLGATGLSCARHLAARGYSLVVLDSRREPPALGPLAEAVPAAVVLTGTLDTDLPADAVCVVLSPGLAPDLPLIARARERALPVIGDIELFAREARRPVAAITGSNGKSTVTTMLVAMAERAGRRVLAGGNLGTPALDLLARPLPDFYALELSSFQLATTSSLQARVAVVLNVSPDHIDRHGSVAEYAAAKARIYAHAAIAVINRDDDRVRAMPAGSERIVSFGMNAPDNGDFGLIERDGEPWLARGRAALMPAREIGVPGRHNVANGLAALALGEALDLPMDAMLDGLRGYQGLAHRTQRVGGAAGMTWIDDSKATNVGAAVAAIEGLPGPLVIIAGGDGKGADFMPLARALHGRARLAILLGKDAGRLAEALRDVCPVRCVADMAEAVRAAARHGERGDTVLLSPACSSLDMYSGFAERGAAFAAAVRELTA
jgi:UDP-N-acetylmuramoylalanine--D-glutamate ligase